jgi:multidrug resistance efflux pump
MPNPFARSQHVLETDRSCHATWGLLLAAALLVLWSCWFWLARVSVYAVSDTADLEVAQAAHPVDAQFAGRVVAANLAIGREVHEGEVLVELDADTQKLQLREERTRMTAIGPQLDSLADQIAAEEKAAEDEKSSAAVALNEARAHYREGEAAAGFSAKEADRARQMHADGVISSVEWERALADAQQRRAAADSLKFAVSRLEAQQLTQQEQSQAHLEALRSDVNRLKGEKETVAAGVSRLEDEVDRRLIRAPVSGTLGEVAGIGIGSVVREGDKLADVIPEGELRVVASFLPPDALGRIRPGQRARMRLQGFPWTQFGSLSARVTNVASGVRDGHIRVELAVNPDSSSRIPLQHGLPGSIEVEVERISPAVLILRMVGKNLAKSSPAAVLLRVRL